MYWLQGLRALYDDWRTPMTTSDSAMMLVLCVLHIEPFILRVDTQHTQCPC